MSCYQNLCVAELKKILRERRASLKGKKKDLLERLRFYDENNNFAVNDVDEGNAAVPVCLYNPKIEVFKDINATTNLPPVKKENIFHYLNRFDVGLEKGERMYKNEFLLNLRMAEENNLHYFYGQCKASMKKAITYHVNVHITSRGMIEATQCDCCVGEAPIAHCKHVIVVLLAIEQLKNEKLIILNKTSTQKLQSFHKPTKNYFGTPVKAENIPRRRKELHLNFNPVDPETLNGEKYREKVRNLCINYVGLYRSTMPFQDTIMPANPYAIVADHDYELDQRIRFLREIKHINVTESDINKIEMLTRDQSNSKQWHKLRKYCITSSNFHACCNLVQRILNPTIFKSKETQHGKDCERKAIDLYKSYGVNVLKNGLMLMQDKPYLAATPDGLIGNEVVVEVKCPYNQRNYVINEETIPYLWKNDSGLLYLEQAHPYYFQIQGQLMVTGRKYANLLVYTFVDWKVARNNMFIKEMEHKVTLFYQNYFQPALFEKYLYKNYAEYFYCDK